MPRSEPHAQPLREASVSVDGCPMRLVVLREAIDLRDPSTAFIHESVTNPTERFLINPPAPSVASLLLGALPRAFLSRSAQLSSGRSMRIEYDSLIGCAPHPGPSDPPRIVVAYVEGSYVPWKSPVALSPVVRELTAVVLGGAEEVRALAECIMLAAGRNAAHLAPGRAFPPAAGDDDVDLLDFESARALAPQAVHGYRDGAAGAVHGRGSSGRGGGAGTAPVRRGFAQHQHQHEDEAQGQAGIELVDVGSSRPAARTGTGDVQFSAGHATWRTRRHVSGRTVALVLLNPVSGGRGASRAVLDTAAPLLRLAGFVLRVEETQYAGHGFDMARDPSVLDPGVVAAVIVVGGDGTLSEVINACLSRPDWRRVTAAVTFGLLPAGSDESMAKKMGIRGVPSAVLSVARGRRRPLDVNSITDGEHVRYSICGIGLGIPSRVAVEAEARRWMGFPRYVIAAVNNIVRLSSDDATLSCRLVPSGSVVCGPECLLCDRTTDRAVYARSLAASEHRPRPGTYDAAIAANPHLVRDHTGASARGTSETGSGRQHRDRDAPRPLSSSPTLAPSTSSSSPAGDDGLDGGPRAAPRLAWGPGAATAVASGDGRPDPVAGAVGPPPLRARSKARGVGVGVGAGSDGDAGDEDGDSADGDGDRDLESGLLLGGGDPAVPRLVPSGRGPAPRGAGSSNASPAVLNTETVRIPVGGIEGAVDFAVDAGVEQFSGDVPRDWIQLSGRFQVMAFLKGSYVFPTTHLGDGCMDILAVCNSGRFQLLHGLASILLGAQTPASGVAGDKTRSAVIDIHGAAESSQCTILVDGDTFVTNQSRVTVQCHQGAVRLYW